MPLGELIEIEKEFFAAEIVNRFAEVLWVLLAFERFGEIEIAAQAVGDREVGLLDAREHFLIKLLLEIQRGLQNRFGVGVLGFEVGNDFRVFLMPKPVVMVDAAVAMKDVLDGFPAGNGRCQR